MEKQKFHLQIATNIQTMMNGQHQKPDIKLLYLSSKLKMGIVVILILVLMDLRDMLIM